MNLETIDGHKVIAEKNGKYYFDGLFTGCFKTEGNRFYYIECELPKRGIIFRRKVQVTESTFENFYWKDPKIEPLHSKLGSGSSDTIPNKSVPSHIEFQNFFEDESYFSSGKLHKVHKHELVELALSISGWVIKTSIPDDAIVKTYSYMQERFLKILSNEEIRDFTIELLGIRMNRLTKVIDGPLLEKKSDPQLKNSLPVISVVQALNAKGYRIHKKESNNLLRTSKIGGYPDLTKGSQSDDFLKNHYFLAQINTIEIPENNQRMPKGMFSFFIDKTFKDGEYYRARTLKTYFANEKQQLVSTKVEQEILDEFQLSFEAVEYLNIKEEHQESKVLLSSQFLPDLIGDDYAEMLITCSFSALGIEESISQFPEIKNKENITMTPLLRLKGSDLLIKGKYCIDALNIVFYTSLEDFNKMDFTNCYFAAEP